jgi:uncharacterized protein
MASRTINSERRRINAFPQAVIVEGAIGLAAIVLAWLFRVPIREQMPTLDSAIAYSAGRGIVATIPLLIIFAWLARSSWPPFVQLREQVERLVDELFAGATLGQLALVALLAGVGEELLFRGVLQSVAIRWTTPVIGVMIASLLFGAAHALSKLYFVLATLISVYFAWIVLAYHDLFAAIVAHSMYDFAALLYFCRFARSARSMSQIQQSSDDADAQ